MKVLVIISSLVISSTGVGAPATCSSHSGSACTIVFSSRTSPSTAVYGSRERSIGGRPSAAITTSYLVRIG
jgi:hypothetical protein